MLQWITFAMILSSSAAAVDPCEEAHALNKTICHEALIDPIFKRAHRTSPRSNSLIYNLSQSCLNDISNCFEKCDDPRFKGGNKFMDILKTLRAPLGFSIVSLKTKKCRDHLNDYAKKIVKVCEKFKVHQSAAADVSNAKQRILSTHCSYFSTYLSPIKKDGSQGVKAAGGKGKSKNSKGVNYPALNSGSTQGLEVTSGMAAGDSLSSIKHVDGETSPDIEMSMKGMKSIDLLRRGLSVPNPGLSKKKKSKAAVKPLKAAQPRRSTYQPGKSQVKKIKKKQGRSRGMPLKKQRDGLEGNNFHGDLFVPDPGSGQVVPRAGPGQSKPVTGVEIQNLSDKVSEKMVGSKLKFPSLERGFLQGPPEVFRETQRTFQKIRNKDEFIE